MPITPTRRGSSPPSETPQHNSSMEVQSAEELRGLVAQDPQLRRGRGVRDVTVNGARYRVNYAQRAVSFAGVFNPAQTPTATVHNIFFPATTSRTEVATTRPQAWLPSTPHTPPPPDVTGDLVIPRTRSVETAPAAPARVNIAPVLKNWSNYCWMNSTLTAIARPWCSSGLVEDISRGLQDPQACNSLCDWLEKQPGNTGKMTGEIKDFCRTGQPPTDQKAKEIVESHQEVSSTLVPLLQGLNEKHGNRLEHLQEPFIRALRKFSVVLNHPELSRVFNGWDASEHLSQMQPNDPSDFIAMLDWMFGLKTNPKTSLTRQTITTPYRVTTAADGSTQLQTLAKNNQGQAVQQATPPSCLHRLYIDHKKGSNLPEIIKCSFNTIPLHPCGLTHEETLGYWRETLEPEEGTEVRNYETRNTVHQPPSPPSVLTLHPNQSLNFQDGRLIPAKTPQVMRGVLDTLDIPMHQEGGAVRDRKYKVCSIILNRPGLFSYYTLDVLGYGWGDEMIMRHDGEAFSLADFKQRNGISPTASLEDMCTELEMNPTTLVLILSEEKE